MKTDRLYSEIFEEFEQAPTRAEKISVLKKYGHPRFQEFLVYAMNPNVKWDVEVSTYRPAPEPAGLNYTYLHNEVPKMHRFMSNHPKSDPKLKPEKKRALLTGILEALHKDEAALLVRAIKSDLDVKYLTPKLVAEAFPGINIPTEAQ
jgi:hypothetical protein